MSRGRGKEGKEKGVSNHISRIVVRAKEDQFEGETRKTFRDLMSRRTCLSRCLRLDSIEPVKVIRTSYFYIGLVLQKGNGFTHGKSLNLLGGHVFHRTGLPMFRCPLRS